MPSRQEQADDRDFVQSLDRGLAVIRAFGEASPRMTLSEAASHAGISRAAARRLLLTLQRLGYVGSEDGRRFFLRPTVLELGYAYLAGLPWWREAQRLVGPLAVSLGHPCAVGVLDGIEVVYVAYAAPTPLPGLERAVGTRLPAHATAIGRVLLAGLTAPEAARVIDRILFQAFTPFTETNSAKLIARVEEVRAAGCCIIDQELRLGLRSLAVPIMDRSGRTRAAISVSFGLLQPADPSSLTALLRDAATQIGESLH